MAGYRKITVDGRHYEYRVGSACTHIKRDPEDDSHDWVTVDVRHEEMLHISSNEVERAANKGYLKILPSYVKEYIQATRRKQKGKWS